MNFQAQRRKWECLVGVAYAFCAVACGSDQAAAPQPGPGTNPTGCDALELAPPESGKGVQFSIDVTFEPGDEREYCKLVLAGEAVNMNWGEGIFTRGAHHGLIFRTNYRDALPTTNTRGEPVDASQAVPCDTPVPEWDATMVLVGGHPSGVPPRSNVFAKGVLPENVAVTIPANEVLLLNFHMLNTTTEAVHGCFKVNLNGIPDSQVEAEAGAMLFYNSFITLPARATATAEMACPVSHDLTLTSATSHMHSRGIGARASLLDGDPLAGGAELRVLHETTAWEEPQASVFSPGLPLTPGQWIRWSCDYSNPEDRNIAQGLQTTDEMCEFVGAYWPRNPLMDACANAVGYMGAGRYLSSGTRSGAEFVDCWAKSPQLVIAGGPATSEARYATQRCVTDSCLRVSGRINDYRQGLVDIATVTCD